MSGPEVSVVIPVWDDYCRFLPDAVDSALAQDVEVEVVVVDNASRVPLPELPEGARVIRSGRRLTAGAVRNVGVAHARAPLVSFLDADDKLLEGGLADLYPRIAGRPDVVAAAGRVLAHNVAYDSFHDYPTLPLRKSYALAPYPRVLALVGLLSYLLPVSSGLLRREAVIDAGGFGNLDYAEDWGLAAALGVRGRLEMSDRHVRLYRMERGSLYFRVHPRSTSLRSLRDMRRRVWRDPAAGWWLKVLLPLVALGHWVKVMRHTPGGREDPAAFYIGPEPAPASAREPA